MKKYLSRVLGGALIFTMMLASSYAVLPSMTMAASVTSLSDALSRVKASTAANHEIKFVTPTGASAGNNITLTFSSDFTGVSSVAFGDVDFAEGDSSNCTTATFTEKTLAGSPSGATWGVGSSGQVTTLTSGTGTVTANRCVRIRIGTNATTGTTGTNQITNGAADDDDTIAIGGTFGDSGTASIDIIADDQVVVSATVDPTITFSVSDSTIGFGTLSSASAKYATGDATGSASETEAHQLGVSTNGASGYALTINGSTLTSGGNTIDAIGSSNTASSAGTEQFGVRMSASGGSGTVTAPYAASGFAFDTASFPDQVAGSTASSATTTYSVRYLANIASTTEAGAYTTTLTYIASGNF